MLRSDAEQRDVAQDIVLSAVKATTRMKAQAATQQQQQASGWMCKATTLGAAAPFGNLLAQ